MPDYRIHIYITDMFEINIRR